MNWAAQRDAAAGFTAVAHKREGLPALQMLPRFPAQKRIDQLIRKNEIEGREEIASGQTGLLQDDVVHFVWASLARTLPS